MKIVKFAAVALIALTPALVSLPAQAQTGTATTTTSTDTSAKKTVEHKGGVKAHKAASHKKVVKTETKTDAAK